ncbi:phosphoribosylformylglycinamidine synthase subunit PurL [Aureliella helgolandensis]|uniref:Phosphoribosylformylglycinamidine synthase subunit PurL n=1 Tax=Aureliella helgolandensis TaxID=2527968 RepID=A0A518G1L1_9BACT|nr:phosphoribosylformylglycinamidine synthase subunit PurL [Aureliella helgolandensis]QDV22477.1 Phosphoribosylformylglycinamidine synthase subunit PurL [Aureliella helgolandensis]
MTLWEIDVLPAAGQNDVAGQTLAADARDLGLDPNLTIAASRGFLLQGELSAEQVAQAAEQLLADSVTESATVAPMGDAVLAQSRTAADGVDLSQLVHVLPKPGVMDPVALSTLQALQDMGLPVEQVSTLRKYWLPAATDPAQLKRLCQKLLFNDSIERVVTGPLNLTKLDAGSDYQFSLQRVPIRELNDEQLLQLSKQGQLYLTLTEMQTIAAHFQGLNREPTDIELETVAQTWSEHCSHKTLAGRIAYTDENGSKQFKNMLKETIFQATVQIRQELGDDDWCVKVFSDNAGVVKFDDDYHVVFKVETHNHPSAIEPYGGSNTGIGGVIRDPMGTGLGAKPFCNTDIFCFAPPNTDPATLPPGVLHPRRVMKGVVSGVRDYGNRMGIPTVNGAVYFDPRYLGNPLVYCGNAGLLPVDKVEKEPLPGDYIVTIGGRTGRDGIHGATFSSAELTSESESISGGSVQIGNAITEKMVLDVMLQARDEELYSAVTDCGAGGFSSAVGEMGEKLGAEVWLDRAPLKYAGLSYTEIWISEAQERMVFAVPPEKLERMQELCAAEGVEASVIGQFVPTGMLRLMYDGQEVGSVAMEFLHDGRPPVVREATYAAPAVRQVELPAMDQAATEQALSAILGSLNVASKHWVIRQYDHEVQAGSAIKPLVGPQSNGPGDAAVVRPRLESQRGVVISCGMNPYYGDLDPYDMAASAIDEAIRNAVAVGANPTRIAILDNFCWGNTDRPETLGTLVRAALACHDVAIAWKTPFISGKDSLNNEFSWVDEAGVKQTLAIPPSLLISAMGQVEDVAQCVTMDLKEAGNPIYLVGATHRELGGSHVLQVLEKSGGQVPKVRLGEAQAIFQAVHAAIRAQSVRACHDLSEGGLAVALAEMAFAGQLGLSVDLQEALGQAGIEATELLFSESNSRFLIEVDVAHEAEFKRLLGSVPCVRLGEVVEGANVTIAAADRTLVDRPWQALFEAWHRPLDWA